MATNRKWLQTIFTGAAAVCALSLTSRPSFAQATGGAIGDGVARDSKRIKHRFGFDVRLGTGTPAYGFRLYFPTPCGEGNVGFGWSRSLGDVCLSVLGNQMEIYAPHAGGFLPGCHSRGLGLHGRLWVRVTDDHPDTISLEFEGEDDNHRPVHYSYSNLPVIRGDISVSGRIVPQMQVSPPTLDFGKVKVRDSGYQSFQVTNVGSEPALLHAKLAGLSGRGFSVVSPSEPNILLCAGQSATVRVRFAPRLVGRYSGRLTIRSNDPNHPSTTIYLSGTGVRR